MASSPDAPPQRKPTTTPDDRVPVPQKIAYGLGTANDMWGNWLYPTMVWPVFNQFLLVSPHLISIALMVNRLVDAASDPFFGWLSDNTRSRWGRRRPYILLGSLLAGITIPILFAVSPQWSEEWIFTFMLISSGIFITIVSAFNMPYQSLGNELTPDYNERTSVFAYKGCIQKIAEVAGFSFALFVFSGFWAGATFADVPGILLQLVTHLFAWIGDFLLALLTLDLGALVEAARNPFYWDNGTHETANSLLAGQVFTAGIGLLMIVIGIVVFTVVRERYYRKVLETRQERISIKDTIYKTLRCRPFRAQLAMSLSYGLSTSMVGTLGYYMTFYYVCGANASSAAAWNFGMGLSGMANGLIGVATYAWIARKIGKRHTMMLVQFSSVAVFVASWWLYDPGVQWLQLVISGAIAFTQGGFWSLYGAIGADVIDYDELETGKRREGAFAATGTYIMKVGLALGIGLSGVVLSRTGFDAALGADQDPAALNNIRLAFAGLPIAGLIVAFIALLRFPLTRKRMQEIRAELEARRGLV